MKRKDSIKTVQAIYMMGIILLVGLFNWQCQSFLNSKNTGAKQLVPVKVKTFSSGEVKLLNGPFKESQDAEAKYLLSLNIDRLLSPFLKESGFTPKDSVYPGWETGVLPGVALSFYLSGMARIYAATDDTKYLTKIEYVLNELEKCQIKNDGYLLGTKNGKKIFARVEKEGCFPEFGHWGWGEATPYYSLEKLMSGLRDVYRICYIQKALTVSKGIGEWLSRHMSHVSDTELQKLMHIEYGGMNWVLADLYADTNDRRFLEMSKRWQDSITVVPMVNGIDLLTKKHANMQFPKYSGLAARYPYSGDKGDLFGARFFWENVVNHRTYVTGGNSESEYFGARDSLAKKLTPYTAENCNSYNMLRLTSLLYQIEPKVEYADYIERTLFNHTLAAQNPEDGKICYFLPLMPGAHRLYKPLHDDFSCCVCSSMDSYLRHAEYIYAYSDASVYVNLFVDSEVFWKSKNVLLRQTTNFPYEDFSVIKITCKKETEFSLRIRNPFWLAKPMTIKVNENNQQCDLKDGYYDIHRSWRKGDIVSITLPMKIRTENMPDDKNKLAFFYGPVLLAGAIPDGYANSLIESNVAPAFVPKDREPDRWLTQSGKPLNYLLKLGDSKTINLQPFFTLKTGAYSVFWQKMAEGEYQQKIREDEKLKQTIKQDDRLTIDKIVITDSISELKHQFSGKSKKGWGNAGILMEQAWRMALDSIGISYLMKVPERKRVLLRSKFMGREAYEKWDFRITVDGTTVYTAKREKDDSYPVAPFFIDVILDEKLTKNKEEIKVGFAKNKNVWSLIPRLMEVSTINNERNHE